MQKLLKILHTVTTVLASQGKNNEAWSHPVRDQLKELIRLRQNVIVMQTGR